MSQLHALAVSLTMEVPAALALALGCRWILRSDAARFTLVAMTTTLLTHPGAWWGFRGLRDGLDLERWTAFALVEAMVCLAEALLYWRLTKLSFSRALFLALLVNALSAFWGWEFARLVGLA